MSFLRYASVRRLSADQSRRPFTRFARCAASVAGRPLAFGIAAGVIVLWVLAGPLFGYSDTWQLMINTTTTVVTFLMVFLIQSSQNRDSAAVQIKLDELIRADEDAHNALLDLEELTEKELLAVKRKYEMLASQAREAIRHGQSDTGIPEVA